MMNFEKFKLELSFLEITKQNKIYILFISLPFFLFLHISLNILLVIHKFTSNQNSMMITFDTFLVVVFMKLCPECCVFHEFGSVNLFLFSMPCSCNRGELGTELHQLVQILLLQFLTLTLNVLPLLTFFLSQYGIYTKCFFSLD